MTDRVYGSLAHPEDHSKLSLPNPMDDLELANFKARVRARHETFNGRLKFYKSLSDTYHHRWAYHVHVFEAICVTVQYQIDNGSPLFDSYLTDKVHSLNLLNQYMSRICWVISKSNLSVNVVNVVTTCRNL